MKNDILYCRCCTHFVMAPQLILRTKLLMLWTSLITTLTPKYVARLTKSCLGTDALASGMLCECAEECYVLCSDCSASPRHAAQRHGLCPFPDVGKKLRRQHRVNGSGEEQLRQKQNNLKFFFECTFLKIVLKIKNFLFL